MKETYFLRPVRKLSFLATLTVTAGLIACSSNENQDSCPRRCEEAENRRCNGGVLERCEWVSDDCLAWMSFRDCAATARVCEADEHGELRCMEPCSVGLCDEPEAARCTGTTIEQCRVHEAGCLRWVSTEDCSEMGQSCFEGESEASCGLECGWDEDCRAGGTCVDGVCEYECETDWDCDESEICLANICVPGCRQDHDCPVEGEICSERVCVPGCRDDDDCSGETEVCWRRVCVRACLEDRDCPEDEVCDQTDWICEPQCFEHSDCEHSQYCDEGHCRDCGGGECDPVQNQGCCPFDRCAFYTRDGMTMEWGCLPEEEDAPGPGEACDWYSGDVYYGNYGNCRGGSRCVGESLAEMHCVALCSEGDASTCDDVYPDGEGGLVDGICVWSFPDLRGTGFLGCLEPAGCDPLCDQPCDDDGSFCLPVDDRDGHFGTVCLPRTLEPERGYTGEPCWAVDSCAPGFICADDGVCRALCSLSWIPGDPTPCEFTACGDNIGEVGDEVCTLMPGTEATLATLDVGVCRR